MDVIRYHRVQPGETLATLSKLYYGTPYNVGVIYQHNRHYIKNPNVIYPGQKLCIPYLNVFERIEDKLDGVDEYGDIEAGHGC